MTLGQVSMPGPVFPSEPGNILAIEKEIQNPGKDLTGCYKTNFVRVEAKPRGTRTRDFPKTLRDHSFLHWIAFGQFGPLAMHRYLLQIQIGKDGSQLPPILSRKKQRQYDQL